MIYGPMKVMLVVLLLVFTGRTIFSGFFSDQVTCEMNQPMQESQETGNENTPFDDPFINGWISEVLTSGYFQPVTENHYTVYFPEPFIDIVSPPPENITG